jgi:aryl-alcohol dehydrogenase-like predicted oxidoreductase
MSRRLATASLLFRNGYRVHEAPMANSMTYGSVPGVNKPVSRIVQGTTMVNDNTAKDTFPLLDAVFASGVNTFDTAHIYAGGGNERAVGRWIKERGIREQVVLIGKGAHHSYRKRVTPWDISADLYDSLARFGTDYIDIYILHRDDPEFPVGPILDTLHEHHQAGRIRAFGGSNWKYERIQEINQYAKWSGKTPFACTSPNLSLAEQHDEPWGGCVSISGRKGEAAQAWYQANQMPIFSWSSMAGGFWAGNFTRETWQTMEHPASELIRRCYCKEDNFQRLERVQQLAKERGLSVPQVSLAWIFSQPLNVFPLIAPVTTAEFEANVKALNLKLTQAECDWLDLKRDSR